MIVVKKFTFNPFAENTYVIWDEESLEAMIVDPGCFDLSEENELADFIKERNLTVKYLVATHCHIDHIIGCRFIKEKYNPPFYAPELDLPLLHNLDKQAAAFGLEVKPCPTPDKMLDENSVLKIGNTKAEVIFTPGHSPGEYCLYFAGEKFLIAGDVLFHRGIGRTDLWGGDYNTLIDSIRSKLFSLPDDTKVYPGHGENTTISEEKKENPFITS